MRTARRSTSASNTKAGWSWWSCAPSSRTSCLRRRNLQCRARQVWRAASALGRRWLLLCSLVLACFHRACSLVRGPRGGSLAEACAPATRCCRPRESDSLFHQAGRRPPPPPLPPTLQSRAALWCTWTWATRGRGATCRTASRPSESRRCLWCSCSCRMARPLLQSGTPWPAFSPSSSRSLLLRRTRSLSLSLPQASTRVWGPATTSRCRVGLTAADCAPPACVQRGQVPAALRRSLIGREVVAGALKQPVLAALERGDCSQAALRLEQGDLKPSQLAMWLTQVEAYMAAASDAAAASEASTLPSLSPPEVVPCCYRVPRNAGAAGVCLPAKPALSMPLPSSLNASHGSLDASHARANSNRLLRLQTLSKRARQATGGTRAPKLYRRTRAWDRGLDTCVRATAAQHRATRTRGSRKHIATLEASKHVDSTALSAT